jgi:hypothetical protein
MAHLVKQNHHFNEIDHIMKFVGLSQYPDDWAECYENSKSKSTSKKIDRATIEKALKFYNLDTKTFSAKCFDCMDMINGDKNLKKYFDLMYHILFIDKHETYKTIWDMENSSGLFSKHGSWFINTIVLLYAVEIHQQNMKNKKFDKEQIKYHIEAINRVCTSDAATRNLDGIRLSQMCWGAYFVNAKIVQIGVLQYEIATFEKDHAFKNKYDKILKKGSPHIKIHIPKQEKLDPSEVEKSLKLSCDYLLNYFDLDDSTIFTCSTWLLSNDVKKILPPNSNIRKFQQFFHIIEQREVISGFLKFIFDVDFCDDYNSLKTETTLQKKLKNLLIKDQKLCIGFGVVKDEYISYT